MRYFLSTCVLLLVVGCGVTGPENAHMISFSIQGVSNNVVAQLNKNGKVMATEDLSDFPWTSDEYAAEMGDRFQIRAWDPDGSAVLTAVIQYNGKNAAAEHVDGTGTDSTYVETSFTVTQSSIANL